MADVFSFLVYVFVNNFSPGPNNVLAMTNGMRFGYKRTLRFILGTTSGFLFSFWCGLLNVILENLLPQVRFWQTPAGRWAGTSFVTSCANTPCSSTWRWRLCWSTPPSSACCRTDKPAANIPAGLIRVARMLASLS